MTIGAQEELSVELLPKFVNLLCLMNCLISAVNILPSSVFFYSVGQDLKSADLKSWFKIIVSSYDFDFKSFSNSWFRFWYQIRFRV